MKLILIAAVVLAPLMAKDNKPAQRLWFPEFADTTLEDENDV